MVSSYISVSSEVEDASTEATAVSAVNAVVGA